MYLLNQLATQADTLAATIATNLAAICPQAPAGAQQHVDELTGYILWGVRAMILAALIVGVGAVIGGRLVSMPHASKTGIISVVVVLVSVIALLIVPGIAESLGGSGCI